MLEPSHCDSVQEGGGGVGRGNEDRQMPSKAKVICAQETRSVLLGAVL